MQKCILCTYSQLQIGLSIYQLRMILAEFVALQKMSKRLLKSLKEIHFGFCATLGIFSQQKRTCSKVFQFGTILTEQHSAWLMLKWISYISSHILYILESLKQTGGCITYFRHIWYTIILYLM